MPTIYLYQVLKATGAPVTVDSTSSGGAHINTRAQGTYIRSKTNYSSKSYERKCLASLTAKIFRSQLKVFMHK